MDPFHLTWIDSKSILSDLVSLQTDCNEITDCANSSVSKESRTNNIDSMKGVNVSESKPRARGRGRARGRAVLKQS